MALGNWGSDEAVPVLVSARRDPDPLVRGHAAWALACIDSADAGDALSASSDSEEDAFVRDELESALERRFPDCERLIRA